MSMHDLNEKLHDRILYQQVSIDLEMKMYHLHYANMLMKMLAVWDEEVVMKTYLPSWMEEFGTQAENGVKIPDRMEKLIKKSDSYFRREFQLLGKIMLIC